MNKTYCLSAAVMKALHKDGSDSVKAALAEAAPDLFKFDYPAFAIGKDSGCLYLLKDENTKIRLTNGDKWTKFKDEIGVVSHGAINVDNYDLAEVDAYTE